MMFLKNDIISNILPIIIKSDSEEFVIPIMSIAKILEIIDNDNIIINFSCISISKFVSMNIKQSII